MAAFDAATNAITRLTDGGGPPLCVVDGFQYRAADVRLQPGDVLCIVSDGVTEAHDPGEALYGAARVERVLAAASSAPRSGRRAARDVKAFASGAEPADDMTVLALRWRGPSSDDAS